MNCLGGDLLGDFLGDFFLERGFGDNDLRLFTGLLYGDKGLGSFFITPGAADPSSADGLPLGFVFLFSSFVLPVVCLLLVSSLRALLLSFFECLFSVTSVGLSTLISFSISSIRRSRLSSSSRSAIRSTSSSSSSFSSSSLCSGVSSCVLAFSTSLSSTPSVSGHPFSVLFSTSGLSEALSPRSPSSSSSEQLASSLYLQNLDSSATKSRQIAILEYCSWFRR